MERNLKTYNGHSEHDHVLRAVLVAVRWTMVVTVVVSIDDGGESREESTSKQWESRESAHHRITEKGKIVFRHRRRRPFSCFVTL